MDIVIRRADVLDGSGSAAFRADIGLVRDRIVEVGDLSPATAALDLDAEGLVAAPGFIDMHSHSDFSLPINPRAESKVRQGVTTEVIGQCGDTAAPIGPEERDDMVALYPYLSWEWSTFAEYLECLRRQGVSVNVVPLVGHSRVRAISMGMDNRAPTSRELEVMRRHVAQAMDEGAWGMSTGLIYVPGVYASTEELTELSRVVADRGGFYFSHIRGEAETLLRSIEEAIEIGKRAGLPVQISHLKASGQANWPLMGPALALIDYARAQGLDVAADQYPYPASSTTLSASVLPAWAREGGRGTLLQRVKGSDARDRILEDMSASLAEWDYDRMVICLSPKRPEYEGLSIAQIAEERGQATSEAALDILSETEALVDVVLFGMSEENVRLGLASPAVMIGSDGRARVPTGPLGEGRAHPRNYGTFPRVLGKYVREERVLSLSQAIYKMTAMPARRLGLSDRGRLAKGMKADLVLFKPATVHDRATFLEPYQYPEGIEYVIVNGQIVVTPDGHTGALPGEILSLN